MHTRRAPSPFSDPRRASRGKRVRSPRRPAPSSQAGQYDAHRSVIVGSDTARLCLMLAPVDGAVLRHLAALRPTARPHLASRSERLKDPHLRAAFAIWGLERAPAHTQPCQRCGLCTASWCEACEPALAHGLLPTAICTACDADKLVCAGCDDKGATWDAARAAYQRLHPEECAAGASAFRVTAVAAPDGSAAAH